MAIGTVTSVPTTVALTISLLTAGLAGSSSEVTELTASPSGRTVSVSGMARFGQEPVVVGVDAPNDNGGGEALGGAGVDIRELRISQPDGSSRTLLFTIRLAGLAGGGLPESIQYNWDIAVDGTTRWSIKSARSSQYHRPGSLDPYAGVFSCVQDPTSGAFTCTQRGSVPAVYDAAEAEIRIAVPFTLIGASPGARISAWPRNVAPVWVQPAVAGAVTPGVTVDTATHADFAVPTPTVRLGIAPAGTTEGNVSFAREATLNPDGRFAGSVTAPSAGAYDVWARACLGASCGARSQRVTTT